MIFPPVTVILFLSDVPDSRSALRLAKLNLSLNDSVGQPFGASAKKTKLLRFAEPTLNSSPVSVQDSPTPSSSHAFPSVTARASLTERYAILKIVKGIEIYFLSGVFSLLLEIIC